jgi:oligoendopeptidase F
MCKGNTMRLATILVTVTTMTVMLAAQDRDRAKVPDALKWNLADIFPSEAAWRTQKEKIEKELPKLREFQGTLGSSPKALADALEYMSHLDKELSRLYVYASMLSDQDTRLSGPQGMQQEMQQLFARFGAEGAFIEPEILKTGRAIVDTSIAAEPRLKTYVFYLNDIFRRASHTLSDAEEKLLADAGPLAGSPSNIYTILTNADFPYPTITLADGKTVKVDQAGYSDLRTSPVRERSAASTARWA